MSSPSQYPTTPLNNRHSTISTASPNRPGTTLGNPLRSGGVLAHPNEEVFYVLDRAQGFIQTIAREAADYRSTGYAVLDGYGNRVTQFDAAYQAAVVRHAEADQAEAYYSQFDDVWELIEMAEAMATASTDESIHYSKQFSLLFHGVFTNGWLKLRDSPLVQEEEEQGHSQEHSKEGWRVTFSSKKRSAY